jgi:hypothetical protein
MAVTLAEEPLDGHSERLDLDDLPGVKRAFILGTVQIIWRHLLRCIRYRMRIHVSSRSKGSPASCSGLNSARLVCFFGSK